MFRLSREVRFAINYASEDQQDHPPANSYAGAPAITGLAHYFTFNATVAGDLNAQSNYLLNIKDIDEQIRQRAIPIVEKSVRSAPEAFGHSTLADCYKALQMAWPTTTLESLTLALSPFTQIGLLSRELPMTRLSQKFEFAASHRLHNPALSDGANREIYGKCNNPHGHGHNYELQVTLVGQPNSDGLLLHVPTLERIVHDTIITHFDHKNLNAQLPEFKDLIPSVENIAKVIYTRLKPKLQFNHAKLASVTVWETPKTSCEYSE